MLITLSIKKTGELAASKLNGTCCSKDKRNEEPETVENSQHANNNAVDGYMSTLKISSEKIIAKVKYFVAKFDAWRKSLTAKVGKVEIPKITNFINRRSGRSHRSSSNTKSLSSKSNDGGDPEPAPSTLFHPAHVINYAPAIHVEFASPAFSGGAQ
ncbi:hypothetical protein EXW94_19320 [Enterobacter sp. JMULE2]|uniref:hypothetical protein n=1 Tax=Enterobacter sp. JMULE2 TaxID=2518340 RepID=UPI0015767885|nr:hypothetical protein [Enterobacter sp. JMULE2]NTZ39811.1 hypothetical protein [Enterobacter sp. JMULE2]